MMVPFTVEQFLGVFARYNEAIWPAQVVAYLLGITAVFVALRPTAWSNRAISAVLGLFWLFTGAVYQLVFFREINPAATLFGALYLIQGVLLLWWGLLHGQLRFTPGRNVTTAIGGLFVLYGMVLYPLLGMAVGHIYPQAPMFGVAPCPMTIFTFGMLLWTDVRLPKWVLAVPLLWSLLGFSAALQFGMWEDIGLLVAAVTAAALLLPRHVAATPLSQTMSRAA